MTEFPVVLVINCGSSSIKFSVLDAASCDCLLNGVDQLGFLLQQHAAITQHEQQEQAA